MKKLLLIFFLILITFPLNALGDSQGFFFYSFSKEYSEDNYNNHSIGYELLFDEYYFINCFRLNYRFGENGNILNLHYYIMPSYSDWFGDYESFTAITFGAGLNMSYNINKNIFGIGPHIDMTISILYMFKFNIAYRYNIYFNSKNSHEIEFIIGLMDLIFR